MFKGIDFFSDTQTKPTTAMKQAMCAAELGDEQMGEDPTTLQLEKMMAEKTGKEAAMFFPSATMANQIALRLLTEPGNEIICAENCHLLFAESGGPAMNAQVMIRSIPTTTGIFSGEDVRKRVHFIKRVHAPLSKVVSIENTTNMGGGIAWTKPELDSVMQTAKELELKIHLDGARLFNASVASGMEIKTITEPCDTITVCFSKGLGCATGAVLCFEEKLWARARRYKQLMGGSMRQSGMLAAAAIYALEHHVDQLREDHLNAKLLAEKLTDNIPGIQVEQNDRRTNMVFFLWHSEKLSATDFSAQCIKHGVRFSQMSPGRFRAVLHRDISRTDVERAIEIVQKISLNQNLC